MTCLVFLVDSLVNLCWVIYSPIQSLLFCLFFGLVFFFFFASNYVFQETISIQ